MTSIQVLANEECDPGFADEIAGFPAGEQLKACIQCGVCSASCPLSAKMKVTPRKLVEMIRTGLRDQVIHADTIWYCASCYSCAVRCPRNINLAEVMYAVRCLAGKAGVLPASLGRAASPGDQDTARERASSAAFYRTFTDVVRWYGRLREADLMVRFALKTSPRRLVHMAPLGLRMLLKGKLVLERRRIRGAREVEKLYAVCHGIEEMAT